MDNIIQK